MRSQVSSSLPPTLGHHHLCAGLKIPVTRAEVFRNGIATIGNRRFKQFLRVCAADFHNPPTVSDTKTKFLTSYSKTIPVIYNSVIQELLVQQHFIRYNVKYKYEPVFALGFVSAFDQIMEGLSDSDRGELFEAYIRSLGEDPVQYRKDSKNLEEECIQLAASGKSLVAELGSGDGSSSLLRNKVKSGGNPEGERFYSKFFAIGLFRILELTGVKDPKALEALVKASGVKFEEVNRDLKMYKGVLTRLSSAKELMRDFLEREKRKSAERAAQKVEANKSEFNTGNLLF